MKKKQNHRQSAAPLAVYAHSPAQSLSTPFEIALVTLATTLVLLIFRWPSIAYPFSLNPDEATFAACAITAKTNIIPYTTWDPTSSGPLNVYPLLWPCVFGKPITFFSGRLLAAISISIVGVILYVLARTVGARQAGLAALLPFLVFHCTAVSPDFVHYSSEMIPNFFLAFGVLLATWPAVYKTESRLRLFAAGFSFACAPLAKWQVGPMAVLLFAVSALVLLFVKTDWNKKGRNLLFFFGGGATPAFLFAFIVTLSGNLEYFRKMVIELSQIYAGQQTPSFGDRLELIQTLAMAEPLFSGLASGLCWGILVSLLMTCLLLLLKKHRLIAAEKTANIAPTLILVFTWLLGAFATLLTTGRDFPHYLLFIVPPLCACFGLVFACIFLPVARHFFLPTPIGHACHACLAIIGLFAVSVQMFLTALTTRNPFTSGLPTISSNAGQILNRAKAPEDRLLVWGWFYDVHVETGIPFATRSLSLVNAGQVPPAMLAWLGNEYVNSIQQAKPEWFLEAVTSSVEMMAARPFSQKTIESFPELAKFINNHYKLVTVTNEGRLFAREDIAEQRRFLLNGAVSDLGALSGAQTIPPGATRRFNRDGIWYFGVRQDAPCIVEVPRGAVRFSLLTAYPPVPFRWAIHWINELAPKPHLNVAEIDFFDRVNSLGQLEFGSDHAKSLEFTGVLHQYSRYLVFQVSTNDVRQGPMAILGLSGLHFFDINGHEITPSYPWNRSDHPSALN